MAAKPRNTHDGCGKSEPENPRWFRFLLGPRCGAKNRAGKPCQAPAMRGKKRCRVHGGARGSGAPKGERNGAYRTGEHTQEAIAARREVSHVLKACRRMLADVG